MKIIKLTIVFLTLILANCSSSPSFQELSTKSNELYEIAIDLDKNGKKEEALRIMDILSSLYSNDPKVKAFISTATEEQKEAIFTDGLLGINKGIRAKVNSSVLEKVLWYFPDRILDALEMGDYWLSVGPQLGLGVKATSAVQAEAFVGGYLAVGFGQKKMLGIKSEGRSAVLIGPFGPLGMASSTIGTGGFQFGADFEYFHTPSKAMYQDIKDYWGIGGRFGFFIVGGELELHPVEVVDFLGGIFLLDPLNDDFATTRGLSFTSRQRSSIKDYLNAVRGFEEEDIEQFRKKFPSISGGTPAPTAEPAKVEAPVKNVKKGK